MRSLVLILIFAVMSIIPRLAYSLGNQENGAEQKRNWTLDTQLVSQNDETENSVEGTSDRSETRNDINEEAAESPDQLPNEKPVQENSESLPIEDESSNVDSDLPEGGDDAIDQDSDEESIEKAPLTIQLQTGKKWIDDHNFNADSFEFITEWYLLEQFPLKMGPVLSYSKLTDLSPGFISGQIIEFALRSSIFWDFGMWAPYVVAEYVVFSSGSLDMKTKDQDTFERGTLDLEIRGYSLKLGIQIKASNLTYLTIEGSVLNGEQIKQSGTLGTLEIEENSGEIQRSTREVSMSGIKKFTSLSIGILFEI